MWNIRSFLLTTLLMAAIGCSNGITPSINFNTDTVEKTDIRDVFGLSEIKPPDIIPGKDLTNPETGLDIADIAIDKGAYDLDNDLESGIDTRDISIDERIVTCNETNCQKYYKDSDHDDYSDPDVKPSECICSPEGKYNLRADKRKGDDCNDNNPMVHPGATDMPELKKPFLDTNCDGVDGDASKAIFVGTTGHDTDTCGTMKNPCKTITKGLDRAEHDSKNYVLVAKGDYKESIVLKNGIGIYGGYDKGWNRDASFTTTIQSTGIIGVTSDKINKLTILNLLVLMGKNVHTGQSSYVFVAKDSSKALKLSGVSIEAGNGGHGMYHVALIIHDIDGHKGHDGDKGGEGGQSACSVRGGNGGKAHGCKTGPGETAPNGAAGGAAGQIGCKCTQSGKDGKDGADGKDGKDGTDGTTPDNPWGSVTGNGLWGGQSGKDGTYGQDGHGGGGGGSGGSTKCGVTCDGGPGGGGSSGGCGGSRGFGGGAGGGSFGILAINSPITIMDCPVKLGQAGDGADGAEGGKGGQGADGGDGSGPPTGCVMTGKGGNGGNGGDGGDGGNGSGGCGGDAVGIGWKGRIPVIKNVYYSGGKAGTPGDGPASNNGCEGKVAQTHSW